MDAADRIVVWAVAALLGGCSSSPVATDGGVDGAAPEAGADGAPADAGVDARVPPRAAVSAAFEPPDAGCAGPIFAIGQLPSTLLSDGAGASVACTVHPMGAMFKATLTANSSQNASGMDIAVTLTGSGAQTVDVMLRDMAGMPVMKMGCTGTYPQGGGVAAGRVWMKLDCPGSMIDPPPGNCPVQVEARFEGCGQ